MARMRIRDIAEQAHVSPATVSRFLNNQPGQMTEETRQRIAEVIERTGYRPRTAARNLRKDRSGVIGVVLADIRNPYSSAMLEELSAAAEARGYALMTAVSGNDPHKEQLAFKRLIDADVDGLVINTCGACDEAVRKASFRVPAVLLDRDILCGGIDLVSSNNAELSDGLVATLQDAGCDACWLFTEADDSSPVRRERADAFVQSIRARGLTGGVVAVDQRGITIQSLLERIKSNRQAHVGFVAVNGLVFLRVIEALASDETSTTKKLRIATFDDYPWNHVIMGGITTAAQDTSAIAATVLDRMMLRIDLTDEKRKAQPPVRIEVPGAIIHRASTALSS